jgi:hypothetical protein
MPGIPSSRSNPNFGRILIKKGDGTRPLVLIKDLHLVTFQAMIRIRDAR